MRLRLTIKRHGLPATSIVWDIDTLTAPTILQLLEQVNDIIPIEAGEWGLEDYAVEIKGKDGLNYECLHFQPVGKVLRDEDEVIIRPLLTQDLRIRRVSGRHQISADGRHLIDGIAFGRPHLRRPADRPPVNIPPRKRRKITYTGDEDDDEGSSALKKLEGREAEEEENDENANRQLVLHADFDDEDEEEDDDFEPGGDGDVDDDSDEELEEGFDSDEENVPPGDEDPEDPMSGEGSESDEVSPEIESTLADVSDKSMRAKIRKLHSAFPTAGLGVVKHVVILSKGDDADAFEALTRGFLPTKSFASLKETTKSQVTIPPPKTWSKSKKSSIPEPVDEVNSQIDSEEDNDEVVNNYDQGGLPLGSIASGKALIHMAEAVQSSSSRKLPGTRRSVSGASNKSVRFAVEDNLSKGLTSTPLLDHESSEESETSSSEEDSSSSSESDSANEDSSEDESDERKPSEKSSSDTDSSRDSSSEDSSSGISSSEDEGPEKTSSKFDSQRSVEATHVSTSIIDSEISLIPPGKGKRSTQIRNQRRRNANRLARFIKNGILPAGTTSTEFIQLNEITRDTPPDVALAALKAVRSAKQSAKILEQRGQALTNKHEFEALRQKLLASIASGGIEASPDLSRPLSKSSCVANQTLSGSSIQQSSQGKVEKTLSTAPETFQRDKTSQNEGRSQDDPVSVQRAATPEASSAQPKASEPSSKSTLDSATPARRIRLDLSAGRRLLFGALGIKTPKTKTDEDLVRNNLMKDIRPIRPTKLVKLVPELSSDAEASADENPDAWKERITLRAVECCHDGVELSEPPFPFVQRWDPQQQNSWPQKGKRGGKRKKDQRDQPQYYDAEQHVSKKQKLRKGNKHNYALQQECLDNSYQPSYQEDATDTQPDRQTQELRLQSHDIDNEINQRIINDLNDPSAPVSQVPEDLVELPTDLTSLPGLKPGEAKPGMVVAFKRLICSAETKWQPVMSKYLTAVVVTTSENIISLTLAKRDRPRSEKLYDERTGERIYGKFEVPEDEEEEEDGLLDIAFSELEEPKIVAAVPVNLKKFAADLSFQENPPISIDHSTTLSHEENSAEVHESVEAQDSFEAQFSHITETPLHSDNNQESVDKEVHNDEEPPNAPSADPEIWSKSVSEEARMDISRMMKEAGFRSSVPSSVMKEIHPNGMEISGDAELFEKLAQDMAEIEDRSAFSPKFHGFSSSSPVKKLRNHSSPVQATATQSTWQTVVSPSGLPVATQQDSGETINPKASSSTARDANKQSSIANATPVVTTASKKVPVSEAQAIWEALQPRRRSQSPTTRIFGHDGVDESNSNTSVQYPKLSIGSSFTSQITDHGRQPDFNFDDSAQLNDDTPKVPTDEEDLTELPSKKPAHVDVEDEETEPSSDDPFPTLEVLFSQRSTKRKKSKPIPSKEPTKSAQESRKAMADLSDGESEDANQLTPKASQNQTRISNTQHFQDQPSQPRASQQPKFTIPQGSQVIALSSDDESQAEDEPGQALNKEDIPVQAFKRYGSDGDDNFHDEKVGWAAKKKSSLGNLKTRREANTGLRPTSQTFLRSRRKTTSKF
ncbi:hypothetical protein B7494_g800 [Chlorociboria aeruginascens]|nr:hypothetical protein B7494_g800 [Chlorociboria aeruginascens]